MTQPILLGIFAHPDDESFGPGAMLAKYAREGADVQVCIATNGGAGSYEPALLSASGYDTIAQVRKHELLRACAQLGVQLHMLDYCDSGMNGDEPDALANADLDEVAADIVALIRDVGPDVVVTHDPTGGYFHPDHIKVNQAVLRAYELLDESERPSKLYYTVIPQSQVRWFLRAIRLFGKDPTQFGENNDVDLTRVGMPDADIHVRLDVAPYLVYQARASACHASQGGGVWLSRLPSFVSERMTRYEHFFQAYPLAASKHTDLLEGN